MGPGVLYEAIVNEVLSTLHQEVLVLGIFVVTFGYLRHAVRQQDISRQVEFWQRIVLLGVVTLFSSYVAITYFLEGEVAVSMADLPEAFRQLSPHQRTIAKIMVVLMLPIDLLGVVCMASTYMVLARDEFLDEKQLALTYQKSSTILVPLFFLTGSWHALMIVWWTAYSSLGQSRLAFEDIVFHLFFCCGHFGSALLFRRIKKVCGDVTPTTEWIFFFTFVGLAGSTYVLRTFQYIGAKIST